MRYKRGLINLSPGGAAAAAMMGSAGRGIANAGKTLMNYGEQTNKENMYDNKVKLDAELLDKAEKEAKRKEAKAEQEKNDLIVATATKNSALNPVATTAFKQANPKANAGLVDLGKPEKTEAPGYKAKFLGEDGFMYLVTEDNKTVNTGVKGKDYWQPKGKGSSKTDAPDGYMRETEIRDLNANGGELRNMIAELNGFIEKGGIEYISNAAYNMAKDRLKARGKIDDLEIE